MRRCVESILAQTYADLELIVVDDGSEDGSLDMIEDIKDPRIVRIRTANRGEGMARNRGVEAARGQWIAFLDHDDVWLPFHLAELNRIRSDFPDAGMIGSAYVMTDIHGRYTLPEDAQGSVETINYFERASGRLRPFWIGSLAVPRSTLTRLGGFKQFLQGSDSEFQARVALELPVAASSRVTSVYFRGTGGITERAWDRWKANPVWTAADISPAIALVTQRMEACGGKGMPPGIDAYIDKYVRICLRRSLRIGDVKTVRRLRPLFRTYPSLRDRLWILTGYFPGPILRACFAIQPFAGRLLRRGLARRA